MLGFDAIAGAAVSWPPKPNQGGGLTLRYIEVSTPATPSISGALVAARAVVVGNALPNTIARAASPSDAPSVLIRDGMSITPRDRCRFPGLVQAAASAPNPQ